MATTAQDRPTPTFILIGITEGGEVRYYAGRAGTTRVDASRAEAFAYTSHEQARRRAAQHNAFTGLHGLRFAAVEA